ncbi:MAG: hypothetical protein FWH38_06220 [Treponema sp.]|nr:hypothetical protein [Treponema sp.]
MKKGKMVLNAIAGALLAFALAGCGPKGGTLTLVNESSYTLTDAKISLGNSGMESLVPGQWMKASVEKNVSATASFYLSGGDGKVTMQPAGSWGLLGRWNSGLVGVNGGNSVIITVMNKSE